MEKIEIYTAVLHGEGWITLIERGYKKVLSQLIKGEIELSDLRISEEED